MNKATFLKKLVQLILIAIIIDLIVWAVIQPSDYMAVEFDSEFGLHLKPNQSGVWSYWPKKDIEAKFSVNINGWNTIHNQYIGESKSLKIAIIGDSYVEGRHVNIEATYPVQLGKLLNKKKPCNVYPFACSGWNAAQYLHVLPIIAQKYKPKQIIINIERNDFIDANFTAKNKFGLASFKMENSSVKLIPPTLYETPLYKRALSKSAIARAVYSYANVDKKMLPVTMRRPIDESEIKFADFFYSKIKEYQKTYNLEITVFIDGDRTQFYKPDEFEATTNTYNETLLTISKKHEVLTINLDIAFDADFEINHTILNFENDSHWNAYCHNLVANTVFKAISKM